MRVNDVRISIGLLPIGAQISDQWLFNDRRRRTASGVRRVGSVCGYEGTTRKMTVAGTVMFMLAMYICFPNQAPLNFNGPASLESQEFIEQLHSIDLDVPVIWLAIGTCDNINTRPLHSRCSCVNASFEFP